VRNNNQTEVTITNGASNGFPFKMIASDKKGSILTPMPFSWKIIDTRTAFFYTPSSIGSYAACNGEYLTVFEFYYKLAGGKTVNDLNSETFRFENGLSAGGFVDLYYPGGGGSGVSIIESDGKSPPVYYSWGAQDPSSKPDSKNFELIKIYKNHDKTIKEDTAENNTANQNESGDNNDNSDNNENPGITPAPEPSQPDIETAAETTTENVAQSKPEENRDNSISPGLPGTDIAESVKTFKDIKNHWALEYINFVTSRGIFLGTGNDMFSPDMPMTRAMFVTALARLDGVDLSGYKTSRFKDVPAGQWYSLPVAWAADKKIVNGVSSDRFDPNSNITREQMAVIFYNYIKYKSYKLSGTAQYTVFNDENLISSWASEAVKEIRNTGIITGRPGNIFDPKGMATRAEVATIFTRMMKMYGL